MIQPIDNVQSGASAAAAAPKTAAWAEDGFRIVFSQVNTAAAAAPVAAPVVAPVAAPVAAAAASPFEQSVHTALIGGADVPNNPAQFATAGAADALAKKLGGKVVENSLSGQFSRSAPERMIAGAGANTINAGLALELFAKYGDAQDSEAWRVIRRDLGKTS